MTDKKWPWLVLALLAGLALVNLFWPPPSPPPSMQGSLADAPASPNQSAVLLTIEDLYQNRSVTFSSGESVLAILERLDAEDPSLKLSTKKYAGLGVLVEGLGDLKNGTGGNYWQYQVNGQMPLIGADQYQPQAGDLISWDFKPSEQ